MKSVLISIRPKWCELIASGKKTIEVRKTRPKIETPFRCYIYCTQSGKYTDGKSVKNIWLNRGTDKRFIGNGKVIGEFTCDRIFPINVFNNGGIQNWFFEHMERSCLTYEELADYIGNGRTGYGWHISDLKIYDKPRELREFRKNNRDCFYADLGLAKRDCPDCKNSGCFLERPPQSWCYVEEM